MAGTLKVFVQTATGALVPGIPSPPVYVYGIDKLVQIVAQLLLTNGGRSIAEPGRAGGLRQLVGLNYDFDDPGELFADVRLIITRAAQTIKEEQVGTNRPASERLLDLQLVDIIPNELTLSADISVGVINEEQQVARAVVAL